jgi:NADPH:quinone reductase-like Zn-dependent oxidoreductase
MFQHDGEEAMKAVLLKRAGSADQLVLAEVPKPTPGPNEVLIRVHATSVVRGDVVLRKMPKLVARLFGEVPKSIPGQEFAGKVEAVGGKVTRFGVGDRVFGTTAGLRQGSYAEYLCVPEGGIVARIPPNVRYDQAAPIPVGAMTALHFLRQGGAGPGKRVLINGASGGVGSYAVQIAKEMGAHVTGVSSTSSTELVASLGADEVIDYTKQDFTAGDKAFDVIFDVAGKSNPKAAAKALVEGGRFVTTQARRSERLDELLEVAAMLTEGAIRAVIDRSYSLHEIREAHRHVESGKRGNVVVHITESQ